MTEEKLKKAYEIKLEISNIEGLLHVLASDHKLKVYDATNEKKVGTIEPKSEFHQLLTERLLKKKEDLLQEFAEL